MVISDESKDFTAYWKSASVGKFDHVDCAHNV